MLDMLPYADLLAIHNALSEKPARKFDTRANGVRRTIALMEERGLTLPEAARLADVVLPDADAARDAPSPDETVEGPGEVGAPPEDSEPDQTDDGPQSESTGQEPAVASQLDPAIAPLVNAFIGELIKQERAPYITTFLRRLIGVGPKRASASSETGIRQMTASQRKIVELCSRPEGATGKELADGCGWPSIAARATCRKLADRFGYTLQESPKANGRGISFRLIAKPPVEA